ncbi:hypothetical protein [uncultured Christiangramia sp.]|uniref:hypothetical protein n=1 Tax=uncultured Christiangramia sp. TaxID=503836 RepID=UPI0025F53111|nr:hypothetical protein [uncultured Christiangramia sp.]
MAKVRAAKKPPAYKNIHPLVKNLPDDSTLSLKNVKDWQKHNKERVSDLKYQIRRMDKGKDKVLLEREVENRTVYLANINTYLDTSTWCDLFYGKDQEHKTQYRTLAYAYDDEGYIKTNASIGD